METLNTVIEITRFSLGPQGPWIVFGLVVLLLGLIGYWALGEEKNDPVNKLEANVRNISWAKRSSQTVTLRETSNNEFLEKYSGLLEPQSAEELSEIRTKLIAAGYRSLDAVRWYYLSQVSLGLAGLAVGWFVYVFFLSEEKQNVNNMLVYITLPGAFGYVFPKLRLSSRIKARQQALQDAFPDTLDMMLICVQAGQSLDQTINLVARDIGFNSVEMGEELAIVANELKAGKERAAVLADFGDRTGVLDIKSFTTVMIQAATFGTSISDAINVYAAEMRDKRIMRAEEKANKLPTKMTITTMMLSVPPLMIILLAPSIVQLTSMNIGGLF